MSALWILQLFAVLSLSFHTINAVTGNGALRFIQHNQESTTQSWSSGIVQIYYEDSWGNICDDSSFGSDEADVVCHQLGYTGASSYGNTGTMDSYGTDSNSTLIESVSCSSNYLVLLQCKWESQSSSSCAGDDKDVVVNCHSTRIWDDPSSGQIRLSKGQYSNQGLLEIYCNGEWGTVCDDGFDSSAALVACRQLGYNDYYSYDKSDITGDTQSIWLDSVSCFSSYSCLTSCESCPSFGSTSCTHSEDVTLDCSYSNSSSREKVYTKTDDSCDNTISSAVVVGLIIAYVFASIFCLICWVLICTVPFCICCCLGVGIGVASRSRPQTTVIAHPTTAVSSDHEQGYSQPPGAYTSQQEYPTKPVNDPVYPPPPPY